MDVAEADQEVINSWEEWVQQHQERLWVAHNLAQKNLEEVAEYRQQHHNQEHDLGLSKGTFIYLKDHHIKVVIKFKMCGHQCCIK